MTGQEFAGRFVAGDGDVARATFDLESDHVVITGPNGRKHRWSVHEIAVTAVSSPRFQFDIAGEKAVFEADSPSRFLFEFLPALRAARQQYPPPPPPVTESAIPGPEEAAGASETQAAETAPAPVDTLVAEAEGEEDRIDLVIDLRPQTPAEPAPQRSLSDAVRRHKENAPSGADTPGTAPSDAHTPEVTDAGTVVPRDADAGIQLREPWDTITPKLTTRAAGDQAHPGPNAESEKLKDREAVRPVAGAAAPATETDKPGATAEPAAVGGSETVPEATDQPEQPGPPDPSPGVQRPPRSGPGITRTGLGDLVKAARGASPDAPPVSPGDISDLRNRARQEQPGDAASSGLLDDLRRRWRSRRRPRDEESSLDTSVQGSDPPPGPSAAAVSIDQAPEAPAPVALGAKRDELSGSATQSGDAVDAAATSVRAPEPTEVTTVPAGFEPPTTDDERLAGPPGAAAAARDARADACAHEWDPSPPPGAVTRICVRCNAVEAIPTGDEPAQPPPGSDPSPRPSARSELLRRAAARRRAYRNRRSG